MTAGVPDTSVLGAHVTRGGVRFGLWAPRADRVDLVLVSADGRQTGVAMSPSPGGIWTTLVPGIGAQQLYGYRVHGPWDPGAGSRFNPARLLVDPYARAITGGIDYLGPIHDHALGNHFELDGTDSFGSVPLSVVVADTPPPTPLERRRSLDESVIYELHLRGFTKTHPVVPEHLRGNYLGLAYPGVIDYLLALGVTAVELLPVHHFVSEPFVAARGMGNYWGYNTLGFFAPHAFYATYGTTGGQVQEFKTMVSALHEAGIEVILDVVYNHTAEGGHEGPTVSMRGIDHHQYYRLTNDRRDDYDVTGCGNSVNTANPMVAQLVVDSLKYWVKEMGVDGFRFDLATTLLRDGAHHVDQNHPLKRAIETDPAFDGIKLIAEPWDVGPYGYQVGQFGPGWSEWNDRFRDHARDFWRGAVPGVQELATRLSGSPDLYDRPGQRPQSSINFITAHDGFTMRDLVSYDVKHNLANGEANRDGTDNNRSWNHGWEGETEDDAINSLRARQVLNLQATQILAAGTPMLLAGDEFGRTQRGNNNAYCQDNPISWVDWDVDDRWRKVRERTASLLALRAEHKLLRTSEFLYHQEVINVHGENLQRVDLTWMNGSHGQMGEADWHDGERRLLGKYLSDSQDAFLIWFHSGAGHREITLPGLPWASSYTVIWHSLVDDEIPSGSFQAGAPFPLPARSVVVMRAQVPTTAAELLELMKDESPAFGGTTQGLE
ncbi:glycogen debranching protein GlgX [Tessaracoccus sp. OS52]|uniref:glycogen debranching protein GlgX n=1 Tax=Tessaracoccus sp. OS52 TaxID=2886691 RepID=UPI001D112BB6|nr:glycogen debranching protein GlgX [Tessaracoccus sp. OS52]MCC2593035.1 glycogen debranching protein GlgX [Tessaracoccus sp. OS52]